MGWVACRPSRKQTRLSARDRAVGGPPQTELPGAHLLGRLADAAATGEEVALEVAKGMVGLHPELDAEPPFGLLQHRRAFVTAAWSLCERLLQPIG